MGDFQLALSVLDAYGAELSTGTTEAIAIDASGLNMGERRGVSGSYGKGGKWNRGDGWRGHEPVLRIGRQLRNDEVFMNEINKIEKKNS